VTLLRSLAAALGFAAAALAASACYDTPRPECAFSCGPEGDCPEGYTCRPDSWCKRAGVDDRFSCPNSPADAAPPPDAGPDAGLPPDAGPDAGPLE
jgi:hypothetical protein